MVAQPPSTMRKDIASAYAATGARVASWVIISALVYRVLGPADFALLALVRATVGLLNYTTLGLAPAMIHLLARVDKSVVEKAASVGSASADAALVWPRLPVDPRPLKRTLREDLEALDYAPEPPLDFQAIYANGVIIALGSAIMGIAAIALYAALFHRFHKLAAGTSLAQVRQFVFFIGVGTILRLASDPMGAVLQIRSRIALDNLLVTIADVLWMALCAAALLWAGAASFGTPIAPHVHAGLLVVGATFALSGAVLLLLRTVFAAQRTGIVWPRWDLIRKAVLMSLLMYGLFVAAAQLADFLYSPTDYILINRLIDPVVVAVYAPAVQIDAGLYLLVTGLAAVLLPKTALAHAAGHLHTVRRYYVRGTLFSVAVLIPAAVAVYLASPWIFRLWLGNEMKPTQAILWMVLLHTIIGGSSGIGRSILLAIGKVKPFTLSVLIGGTANVLMSYAFVKFGHMGLKGIVLGTILAVAGRCLLWLPWYVMRVLRRMEAEQTPAASAV